jgi:hypothetical protein
MDVDDTFPLTHYDDFLLTMTYDNYTGISTEIALLVQSKAFPINQST